MPGVLPIVELPMLDGRLGRFVGIVTGMAGAGDVDRALERRSATLSIGATPHLPRIQPPSLPNPAVCGLELFVGVTPAILWRLRPAGPWLPELKLRCEDVAVTPTIPATGCDAETVLVDDGERAKCAEFPRMRSNAEGRLARWISIPEMETRES